MTRASRASARASAIAVSVVPMPARGADHGDTLAGIARLAQRLRHIGDR